MLFLNLLLMCLVHMLVNFFLFFSFLFPSLQYCKYSSKVQICFIMVTFSMLPLRANNILAFCIPHSTNSIRYFEQRTIQEKGPRQQYYNKNINQKYSIQKHSFFFLHFYSKCQSMGKLIFVLKNCLKITHGSKKKTVIIDIFLSRP